MRPRGFASRAKKYPYAVLYQYNVTLAASSCVRRRENRPPCRHFAAPAEEGGGIAEGELLRVTAPGGVIGGAASDGGWQIERKPRPGADAGMLCLE